ncbi:hypothetical protein EV127DRAFT_508574 [Xylaria flabelliformis]|nr:hypothetical protein EV127DRAFT_508574 [Xylaria flabelliformis]
MQTSTSFPEPWRAGHVTTALHLIIFIWAVSQLPMRRTRPLSLVGAPWTHPPSESRLLQSLAEKERFPSGVHYRVGWYLGYRYRGRRLV